MSGRHRSAAAARHPLLRWALGCTGLALAALTVVAMQPAGASPATTVAAQLSLSGVASATYPTGGSVVGVHPGDSVTFSASAIPTAGFSSALDPILDPIAGVLTALAPYQVSADFSHFPGGAAATVLNGNASKTFAFPKAGTYDFTWTAQRVTLLGVLPVAFDGNQLAAAGIKLNASNQYVGQVVVSDDPPAGGISVQLPGVSVAPSLPVVGQLPAVGVPGVTTPTIPVTAPGLSGSGSGGGTAGGSGGITYTPPPASVASMVVPTGDGPLIGPDLNSVLNLSKFGVYNGSPHTSGAPGSAGTQPSAASGQSGATPAGHAVGEKPVQIAANPLLPSGQVPVVLAIAAIIVLSLVTATYARMYLLRKHD